MGSVVLLIYNIVHIMHKDCQAPVITLIADKSSHTTVFTVLYTFFALRKQSDVIGT